MRVHEGDQLIGFVDTGRGPRSIKYVWENKEEIGCLDRTTDGRKS